MRAILTPVGNRVFVKLEKMQSQTKSGIQIVKQGEQWQQETVMAEVVSISPDEKELKVGDVLIMRGDAGRWIDPSLVEDDEHVYRVIDRDEVLVLLTPKEEVTLGAV